MSPVRTLAADRAVNMPYTASNTQGYQKFSRETCSRIYYRNAINNGYPVLFIKGISEAIKEGKIKDGDQLEVEL